MCARTAASERPRGGSESRSVDSRRASGANGAGSVHEHFHLERLLGCPLLEIAQDDLASDSGASRSLELANSETDHHRNRSPCPRRRQTCGAGTASNANDVVPLPLADPLIRPIECVLSSPNERADLEFVEPKLLPELTSQPLFDCFPGFQPATRRNPERSLSSGGRMRIRRISFSSVKRIARIDSRSMITVRASADRSEAYPCRSRRCRSRNRRSWWWPGCR